MTNTAKTSFSRGIGIFGFGDLAKMGKTNIVKPEEIFSPGTTTDT